MAENPCEAQQLSAPHICNDVLLDVLHFLRRNEHANVRLTSRRLCWLSDTASTRYSPHVVPRLEMRGLPAAEAPGAQIVANSLSVHPASGDSYLVDFPTGEPPEDIVRLSELEIQDFIGPQLLQFLGFSARLMGECWLLFAEVWHRNRTLLTGPQAM